ncbi:MAG: peptidylprolyl isomerase [Nanoarchaeales archaeon]|nr:peptidylprolyl isomerase [Nanoarchaeales archaeon]
MIEKIKEVKSMKFSKDKNKEVNKEKKVIDEIKVDKKVNIESNSDKSDDKSDDKSENKSDDKSENNTISFSKNKFYSGIVVAILLVISIFSFSYFDLPNSFKGFDSLTGMFLGSQSNQTNLDNVYNITNLDESDEILKSLENTNIVISPDTIIAAYGGIELSQKEYDANVEITLFLQGKPSEYRDVIGKEELLNQIFLFNVLYDMALDAGHSMGKEEIISFFERSLIESGSNLDTFKTSLIGKKFSFDELIDFYTKQQTINSYINSSIFEDLDVSEDIVLKYYDDNIENYESSEQVKASHILVNSTEDAELVLSKLKNGAVFSKLAEKYSTGPSASVGGDLGFFGKGARVAEFDAAVFELEEIGDYTLSAVETQFGFHIIKLTGKEDASVTEFDDVKDQIKERLMLEKEQEVIGGFIGDIMNSIEITIY